MSQLLGDVVIRAKDERLHPSFDARGTARRRGGDRIIPGNEGYRSGFWPGGCGFVGDMGADISMSGGTDGRRTERFAVGAARYDPDAGALLQTVAMTAADTYRFTVNMTALAAGGVTARIGGATVVDSSQINAVGINQRSITAPAAPATAGFKGGASVVLTLDDAILVRQTAESLALGAADFFVVPVSTTGVEGTPSGPFALIIP